MAKNKYGKEFLTKNPIRCTFLQVHEPNDAKAKYNKSKYTATLLVDPSDKEVMRQLRDEITGVAEVEKLSEIVKHPFIDDDGKPKNGNDKDPAKYPGYAGMIPIQVTCGEEFPLALAYVEDGTMYSFDEAALGAANYKKMVKKIMYSGAWYHVSLQAQTYDDPKKNDMAVTFHLKGLLKVKDDVELSSGEKTEDLFKNALPGIKTGTALFASANGEDHDDDDEEEEVENEFAAAAKSDKKKSKVATSALDALDAASDEDDEEEDEPIKKIAAKGKPGRPPKKTSNEDISALFGDD